MRTIFFILFSFVFYAVPVKSQSPVSLRLENYMNNFAVTSGFTGSVLVTRNDSVLLKKSYGQIDNHNTNPIDSKTKFWIGSLTKQFTAVCILLLEQRGQLSTEDKLSKYFPEFANSDRITLHQMLCHRSGMYDMENDAYPWNSSNRLLEKVRKHDPRSEPGTTYFYNDTPFLLLSMIVEKVSGKTYGEFLQENIFLPLSMTDSGIMENRGDEPPNHVSQPQATRAQRKKPPHLRNGFSKIIILKIISKASYRFRGQPL